MAYINYPVRCRIVDFSVSEFKPGIKRRVPKASRPHINKEGLAEKIEDGNVRITLDDGNILYGSECWWVPLD